MRSIKDIYQKLPEPLRRDPKKSAVLAGLGLVLCVLGVRHLVGGAGSAVASSAGGAPAAAPSGVIGRATDGRTESARRARADLLEHWLEQRLTSPGRDLFELRPEYFPSVAAPVAPSAQPVRSENFWDRLAKSISSQADHRRQREIRLENVRQAASKVRLQSTMISGVSPRAMIDGRMVRIGDQVSGEAGGVRMQFRVARIGARNAVIERDGVRLELTMEAAGARVLADDE